MRIVFMGTPEFALPSLRLLHAEGYHIASVVTQPDRPRGRGHRLRPTPVAEEASSLGLQVLKPEKVRDPAFIEAMRALAPEAIVLVAFGQLIPKALLELPPLGCINLHPSLLPKHRGASPIHAPLLAGESETGVTTMFMDEGLDTGDIILQERVAIGPWDNAGDLHDRLAEIGARLLVQTLRLAVSGKAPRTPQDDSLASYAPKVEKVEIDWSQDCERVARMIRGLSPSPGAFTYHEGLRLKLLRASSLPGVGPGAPGEVKAVEAGAIIVACGQGAVAVTEVQPEGKTPMSGADFVRGYRVRAGSRMGRQA